MGSSQAEPTVVQAWLAINFLRLSTLARGCSARHAVATGTMRSGVAFLLLIARSGILDRRRSLTISLFAATPGVTSLAQSQTRVARAESALKRRYRSCAADQLYLWRAARAAGSAVPSSAQQLCLCFLGSRVALFRIGCLVQLQQSLRSSVLLLRMRSAIAATARLCLAASAQQDSAQLGAAPLFVFPGG